MRIKFWGTRGSIPTSSSQTIRYGGNTSCVELRPDDGALFILDCGTGARGLGQALMAGPRPIVGNILLTHTHWDHMQGFAFFDPVFQKDNRFTIFAISGVDRSLAEVLSGQMDYLYFPLNLEELEASIIFKEISEETFNVGDVQVKTQFLNHTILTLGFRITAGGTTVVYSTDHEPFSPNLFRAGVENPSLSDIIHTGDRRHVEFLAGADLIIHDAQYTGEEYANKRNWGHSPVEYVVSVAAAAGARQVVLTHHDPDHDDDFISALEARCQAYARDLGSDLQVTAATDGMEIWLPEAADQIPEDIGLQPVTTGLKQARILVVDDEPSLIRFVHTVLDKDGYKVISAQNGEEALKITQRERPDLILLDVMMPKMTGYEMMEQLKATPELQNIPVIMFTVREKEEDIVRGFELGAIDYISKPVASAVLRSRVRRWLLSSEQGDQEKRSPPSPSP